MTLQIAANAGVDGQPGIIGAAAGDTASDSDSPVEFISFSIGESQYGIAIMAVREIKGWTGVTHLPKQPDYVRGVLNLRGVMVPIVDLRCRFGQGTTEATPMHVVLVVQTRGNLVGILADRVLDIVSFEASKIQPVPQVAHGAEADFLSGLITVDDALIALVDLENLLPGDDENQSSAAKV